MKYFGIIKREEIEGFSIEEIEYYLEENNCYDNRFNKNVIEKIFNSVKFDDFDSLQNEVEFKPKIDLINEFYYFIYSNYKNKVISEKYKFFLTLEESFFGYKEDEKRKIALHNFDNIYENLNIEIINIIGEIKSEDNIILTEIYSSKIFKLYMYQLEFKQRITTTKNLINYLIGNTEFYAENFYEENNDIKNAVYFEMVTQTLVELNHKYKFQEDKYFTNQFHNECKYSDNKHIFKDLFGYEFTKHIVDTTEVLSKAEIESLYEVLKCQDLVYKRTKEKFQEFVYYEYQLKISKIISHPYKANWDHDARVLFINTEYHAMKVKKSKPIGLI